MKADGLSPKRSWKKRDSSIRSQVRPLLPNETITTSASPSLRNSSLPRSQRSSRRLRSGGRKNAHSRITSRLTRFQRV